MNALDKITVILVNYKTEDLTRVCVESFLDLYPTANLLLIDNGSNDKSTSYICHMAATYANVTAILNPKNIYHGPAMDQGIRHSCTPYVFILDSDCRILRDGFLELMLEQMVSDDYYAVGRLQHKNWFGYDVLPEGRWVIDYIDPHAMLLHKTKYLQLPPFYHHGAPCIKNMKTAARFGFTLSCFDVSQYIYHIGRGTCSRYGYELGATTVLSGWLSKAFWHMKSDV